MMIAPIGNAFAQQRRRKYVREPARWTSLASGNSVSTAASEVVDMNRLRSSMARPRTESASQWSSFVRPGLRSDP